MRLSARSLIGGIVLAAALSGAPAFAQQAPAGAQGPGSVLDTSSLTTPEQQLRYGRSSLDRMLEAERRVGKLLEQAVKAADEDDIQCVKNAQASIQALRKVGERTLEQLRDALSASDAARAQYVIRQIAVADTKVGVFVAQAESCMDQGVSNKSDSSVDSNASALADGGDTNPLLDPNAVVDIESPDATPFE
ncbi:MAG: hypothetical protein JNM72_17230 [Deltaproteobacteria bacterium]|jgi:hypothetical protein|nr:hypothetical protein [Deltaproteobacteria bacterium]